MDTKRVLIVDDDADIRLLVDFHLSSDGYEVLEASDGMEALGIIKENRVDLIITDITMPVMDGYELIKVLKKSEDSSGIPILVLTGKEEERVSRADMEYQPDDFLPKPFAKEELQKKIERLLAI